MTMSRNALQFCAALGALLYGTAAPAQGLLTEHRLAAGLANEAVAEAVAACAKNGYTVTAIVVDIDGVRQAVLRGDGAPVHTLDSAYAKAYTAASLAPVRKEEFDQGDLRAAEQEPQHDGLARQPAQRHLHAGGRDHHGGGEADRRHRRRRRPRRQFRRRLRPSRARQDQRPDEIERVQSMQIGIAGIGKMGAAIAQRLIEVGHKVTVWNRSADKLKPVTDAGATAVATPAALAGGAEAIITILTDAAAIDTVYNGASGLLTGDVRGKLFIEMSTVQPQTEVALAEQVRAKGAAFVECPVGGSTGPARQGKLIGLMGAAPADAARAKPILDQLCRRLEHCGPVGSGAVMKLTINMPLMIYWQALGEALALCRPLGLDPARIMDLLSDTSGGPNVLKVRGAGVAAMLKGGDGGPVTFDVDSAVKDLRTMLAEGKQRGVALPLVEQTLACYEETKRNVSGAAEVSAVSVYWANRAKS